MSKIYNFVIVSLIDEINYVYTSISKLNNFYKVYKFIIIVPGKDINTFSQRLESFKNVEIIDENKIVNKSEFFNLCDIYLKNKKGHESFRKNWYYQQILKLNYVLDINNLNNYELIIWDADTIPLKKMKFFNSNNEPISYASRYEYHANYFDTNKIIFGKNYKPLRFSSITQFSALNFSDRVDLNKFISKICKKKKIKFSSSYISEFILYFLSLKDNSIKGQHFSEYEFIGHFIFNKYKRKIYEQKLINFFRFDLDGDVNRFQILLLNFFNYKHITYEKYLKIKGNQSYKILFKCLLRDLLFNKYITFKNYQKFKLFLKKFLI